VFAPPPEITAHVVAILPPELSRARQGSCSAWLADRPAYRDFGAFLEGPAFDRTGRLYCVDTAHGRVLRVDGSGRFECVLSYAGAPNGLAIHRDGRLFIADHLLGLVVADPASGQWQVQIGRAFGEPFKGLNDLCFTPDGNLYFTDQGQSGLHDHSGRLLRLSAADGRIEVVLDGIPSPNGLAFTPDGSAIWLAVTRANQVWKLPLTPAGRASKVGVFVTLQGSGPDGLAAAADGSLWVAQPGMGCVWGFSAHGEPIARVRSPVAGRMVTNLAFGAPDTDHLYFLEASCGAVCRTKLSVHGTALYSHLESQPPPETTHA